MNFGEMKKRVALRVMDPTMKVLDDASYGQCVNDAIQDLKTAGWMLPLDEDVSIILEQGVYVYDVPEDFAYIRRLYLEDDNTDPSTYSVEIIGEHWRIGEEDSRNLLYNKDWSFEAGVSYAVAVSAAVTQDSNYHKYGDDCAKVVTSNAVSREGFYIEWEGSPYTRYTVSAWFLGAGGGTVVVSLWDDVTGYQDSNTHTLVGTWTQVSKAAYTGRHSTTFRFYVVTNVKQNITFYVDGVRVQQQPAVTEAAPAIIFDSRYFYHTSGYRIKVTGQKRPAELSGDTDLIEAGMEPFIRERAISYAARTMAMLLPEWGTEQAQAMEGESWPGTRMAPIIPDAEERRSRRLLALSELAWRNSEQFLSEQPMEMRIKPSSTHVPGR